MGLGDFSPNQSGANPDNQNAPPSEDHGGMFTANDVSGLHWVYGYDPKTGETGFHQEFKPGYGPNETSGQTGSGGGVPFPSGGSAAQAATPAAATGATGTAAGAVGAAGTVAGMGTKDWISSLLALYGAYRASQPGKFQQAPESPALTALRAQILGYMQPGGSPTRSMLSGILGPMLEKTSTDQFNLPPGTNGYNPYPNGSAPPKYDLGKILGPLIQSNTQTNTPGGTGYPTVTP